MARSFSRVSVHSQPAPKVPVHASFLESRAGRVTTHSLVLIIRTLNQCSHHINKRHTCIGKKKNPRHYQSAVGILVPACLALCMWFSLSGSAEQCPGRWQIPRWHPCECGEPGFSSNAPLSFKLVGECHLVIWRFSLVMPQTLLSPHLSFRPEALAVKLERKTNFIPQQPLFVAGFFEALRLQEVCVDKH